MARHYHGGLGKNFEPANFVKAPGQWISPTEILRQQYLESFPSSSSSVSLLAPGSYVHAICSGVKDNAISGGNFLLCDGSDVSRTTYADLFTVIGTKYGTGDGSTTFGLPDLTGGYGYLKTTTNAGLSAAGLRGDNVLPDHSHTVAACNSANTNSDPNVPAPHAQGAAAISWDLADAGDDKEGGNNGRHRESYVLISAKATMPIPGCVYYGLLPLPDTDYLDYIPQNSVFPSGQALSRSDYPTLFDYTGTLFGAGDGSTTFNVPDLRGLFLKHTVKAQVSGTDLSPNYMPDSFVKHNHFVSCYQTPPSGPRPFSSGGRRREPVGGTSSADSLGGSVESRPQNIYVFPFFTVL